MTDVDAVLRGLLRVPAERPRAAAERRPPRHVERGDAPGGRASRSVVMDEHHPAVLADVVHAEPSLGRHLVTIGCRDARARSVEAEAVERAAQDFSLDAPAVTEMSA